MMATDGLVALAITVAKGDAAKEKALEEMVTDQPRNADLRSKIAAAAVASVASARGVRPPS